MAELEQWEVIESVFDDLRNNPPRKTYGRSDFLFAVDKQGKSWQITQHYNDRCYLQSLQWCNCNYGKEKIWLTDNDTIALEDIIEHIKKKKCEQSCASCGNFVSTWVDDPKCPVCHNCRYCGH